MGFMNYFQPAAPSAAKPSGDTSAKQSHDMADMAPPHPFLNHTAASSQLTVNSVRSVNEIKHQVLLNHIYQQQSGSSWNGGTLEEGVMIRKARGDYIHRPEVLSRSRFAKAMSQLNVKAAMTVRSDVVQPFLSWSPDAVAIPLMNGLRVQILPEIEDLYRARRHQYAAFISGEGLLVVWDDEPTHLLTRAKAIEKELLQFVWQSEEEAPEEKNAARFATYEVDAETGNLSMNAEKRPILLYNAFLVASAMCLLVVMLGLGYGEIAFEVVQLKRWSSLIFILMTPVNIFLGLFFSQVVVSVFAHIIGPIQQLTRNSKYYSAVLPPRIRDQVLPHVTIQCPVYKEGLSSVIEPTVISIKKAISTYELQGGSANILINDDGMQLLGEEERQARVDFYADNQIGWTARPPHGKDGFYRKGKFKKASNMNYGLTISNKVEKRLQLISRSPDWTDDEEVVEYERCLKEVLEEEGTAWADGNVRVGDYVLIIDSDTRVPSDCLLDAVSEMEQSPDVAIIQFSSGVMQVSFDYFENGVTFFTNLIYTAIRFGVSSGDIAPFVGHNAILRWSAIQEVAFVDTDGVEKFWSESHVSEDFDMALRLQLYGYIVRMVAWTGDGFKEGVSLTVYDELTRWEKYAFGCNELVFNPMRTWLWRGPFTRLFKNFLVSGIPFSSKISVISYVGTYYALGAAWIMTIANYVTVGFYNGYLDKWYVESWKVWISIVMVFTVAANVALAVQRHRTSEKSFFNGMVENFKWCLMFSVLFGGMSLHVSQALCCHMFEIDMSWGATAKEVERSNFFIEVPKVAKKFKYSITISLLTITLMVIMAKGSFIPWSWNITQFVAIFPLAMLCGCHLLLPIVLNPGLMTFSW